MSPETSPHFFWDTLYLLSLKSNLYIESSKHFRRPMSCIQLWTQTISRFHTARWRILVGKFLDIIANSWKLKWRTLRPRDVTVSHRLSPAALSQTTVLSPVLSTGPLSRPEIQPTQRLSQWRRTLALRSLQQRLGSRSIIRISRVTSRTIQKVTSPELD